MTRSACGRISRPAYYRRSDSSWTRPTVNTGVEAVPVIVCIRYVAPLLLTWSSRYSVFSVVEYSTAGCMANAAVVSPVK